jgi:Ca-activated chloride channel homolog
MSTELRDSYLLTAYALGELSGDEAAEMKKLVEESEELQKIVMEIRQAGALLQNEMEKEKTVHLTSLERSRVEMEWLKERRKVAKREKISRWTLGSLAAGAVAAVAVLIIFPRFNLPDNNSRPESDSQAIPHAAPGSEAGSAVTAVKGSGFQGETIGSGSAVAYLSNKKREGEGQEHHTETYDHIADNEFRNPVDSPLSTFSADVDTASYANVRRFLNRGEAPPKDSVRIEELINYFNYDDPLPKGEHPFAVRIEQAKTPWNPKSRLVRISLKTPPIDFSKSRPSLLIFLVDVSGSMDEPNRLPLVKQSLKLLVDNLRDNDRIALVAYAGASGLVLEPTAGHDKAKILAAIENLHAGGSTNGGEGLDLAYKVATDSFIMGGNNRILLMSDGDFNVGTTSQGDLIRKVQEKAKSGVFLSVFGYGMGNLKDSTLEKLSSNGNGNYAYIDDIAEARKVLVEQMGATLLTVAKDVKVQVEFNPSMVESYRLIGYENRILKDEDFNDDKKDAGEIGAGHSMTALYEIVATGSNGAASKVDPLMTVKLRYKKPEGDVSRAIELTVKNEQKEFSQASGDFQFAAAVASFGMIMRDSKFKGTSELDFVKETVKSQLNVRGKPDPYRVEFLGLVEKAQALGREGA